MTFLIDFVDLASFSRGYDTLVSWDGSYASDAIWDLDIREVIEPGGGPQSDVNEEPSTIRVKLLEPL